MSANPIVRRETACPVCGAVIPVGSITSDEPGAPEFLITTGAPWFALGEDEDGDPRIVFVCSTACVEKVFEKVEQ